MILEARRLFAAMVRWAVLDVTAVTPELIRRAEAYNAGLPCGGRRRGEKAARVMRACRASAGWIFNGYRKLDALHYTFEEACDFCDLDPEVVRERLRQGLAERGVRLG